MRNFENLLKYKIERKRLKNIHGGTRYSCTVKVKGFEDHDWTCHAPSVDQCTNPVGLGTQTCIESPRFASVF